MKYIEVYIWININWFSSVCAKKKTTAFNNVILWHLDLSQIPTWIAGAGICLFTAIMDLLYPSAVIHWGKSQSNNSPISQFLQALQKNAVYFSVIKANSWDYLVTSHNLLQIFQPWVRLQILEISWMWMLVERNLQMSKTILSIQVNKNIYSLFYS